MSTKLAAGHPAALLKTAPKRVLGSPEVPTMQTLAALVKAAKMTNQTVAALVKAVKQTKLKLAALAASCDH